MGNNLYRDLSYALDPSALFRDLGYVPDPWQERLLASDAKRVAICSGRQVGKSFSVGCLIAHQLLFRPRSLTLLVAPAQRQSVERLRLVADFMGQLGSEGVIAADDSDPTATCITCANGARAIALPGSGNTIRGYSAVDLLVLEEAAAIPDGLLAACRPMLATKSNARCIALSTPAGKRGWFWQCWNGEKGKWERYHVPSTECPRISAEFLAEERATLGDLLFRQEYLAEFVDDLSSVFTGEQIARALDCNATPIIL